MKQFRERMQFIKVSSVSKFFIGRMPQCFKTFCTRRKSHSVPYQIDYKFLKMIITYFVVLIKIVIRRIFYSLPNEVIYIVLENQRKTQVQQYSIRWIWCVKRTRNYIYLNFDTDVKY